MPHITVEYSRNVESRTDVRALVDAVHKAALETGVVPLGGLRTRALPRDLYRIADGDPRNMFVAITARIAEGRDDNEKQHLLTSLVDASKNQLAELMEDRLALSVEIQQIDANLRVNKNSIHRLMEPS